MANSQNLDTNSSSNLNTLKNTLLNAKIYENPKWLALLHYEKGESKIQKSSNFFLSKKGHKSPKDEYIATIEKLFDEQQKPEFKDFNNSVLCQYPARLYFIAQNLNDERFLKLIDTSKCEGLNEFLEIVPIENIFIEFAAESEIYPGSSMGHIFLHLQGHTQKDINKNINKVHFVRKKGDRQDYAMSYFALLSEVFNLFDYVGALTGTLGGSYVLNPYDNAEIDYLKNEQRSLYVFKVQTNEAQIHLFALHLWELKDKQIAYDFIKHNCTNGIENILGVLDETFFYSTNKPFTTPTEYLQYLVNTGKIEFIELKTPPNKQKFIAQFGSNDILHTRKSSKLTFGVAGKQGFIYFAPIYSDLKNANNAYKELIESRLLSFEARFNGLGKDDKFKIFLHKIEFLQLFSVADTLRTNNLSKLISIKLEPNLYQHERAMKFNSSFNKDTRLFPNLNLGLGLGAYAGVFSFYTLGNLGYRYELIHNPYMSLKSGIVGQFERVKIIGEYEVYYDINANNRGYDSKFSLFAGLNVFKQIDIFAEFGVFNNLFYNSKIFYETKHLISFKLGVSGNF